MKNTHQALLTTLIFFTLCHPSWAGKEVSESLQADPNGKVQISVVRGEIDVQGWDQAQVKIEGELDDATEKLIFERNGDETVIQVEIDESFWEKRWNSSDTNLVVHVPSKSHLVADGVATDFSINRIGGGVEVNAVSGNIEINDSSDTVNLETVSGDIKIANSWGKMKASTVSGDIETDGKAVFFDAQSVSGDIDASIGKSELIEITSVSGDIDLRLELIEDGRLDAKTVSGDIDLKFENGEVNARFEINTGPGGDIRNSLTNDKPGRSFIGAEEVRFDSGNSSGTVEISTMSGTVQIDE